MFDRGQSVTIGKVLDVIHEPDPRLHKVSEPILVVDDSIRLFINDLVATMLTKGVGLAAVQVGVMKRIFVMDCASLIAMDGTALYNGLPDSTDVLRVINPVILSGTGECNEEEGCLSVPGVRMKVARDSVINVEYIDYNGSLQQLELRGWVARCFQHEFDHLNGVTLLNGLSPLKKKMALKKIQKLSTK